MIIFYILIFIMPLDNHPLWSRFAGGLTMIKYVGVACFFYAVWYTGIRRGSLQLFQSLQARAFFVLFLWASFSYFMWGPPFTWHSKFISYWSYLLLFFITLALVDSIYRARWVLLAAVGSVAFASLYLLREYQKFHGVYKNFRPGWVTNDANYFTASALLCLPVAFYLTSARLRRWEKIFYLGCLVVTLAAVMLAASRSGFLGLVAGFLFVIWRSHRRTRNLLLAGVLLIPLVLLAPSSPLNRLMNPTYSDDQSVEYRLLLWQAGLHMLSENPITGVGLSNYKRVVRDYGPPDTPWGIAHNTYLELAAELGIPGLLVYLLVFYGSLRTLGRIQRKAAAADDDLLQRAALGLQGGLISFSVMAVFVSIQYTKLFWLMIFLSVSLSTFTKESVRQAQVAGVRKATSWSTVDLANQTIR